MQIQNPDATQIIRDQAGLTLSEGYPQNLLPNVQPVMDMTPQNHRKLKVAGVTRTSTGSGTVLATSATRSTYVVGFMMSLAKDATADAVPGDPFLLRASIGGVTTSIGIMSIQVTVADRRDIFFSLPYPLLVDKNSSITLTGAAFTVGSLIRSAVVYYYEVD